ncbi:WD repeat domain 34, partial [Perkinsus chesapeaki]
AQVSEIDLLPEACAPVSEEKLLAFLRDVTPRMLTELEDTRALEAADSRDAYLSVPSELDYSEEVIEVVRKFANLTEEDSPGLERCTCVSWSGNGMLLAGGMGERDQKGWGVGKDTHNIAVWRPFRHDRQEVEENDALRPSKIMGIFGSATSVAFHPQRSSIIAAGTNYGQIYVWDMDRNTSVLLNRHYIGPVVEKAVKEVKMELVFRTVADMKYSHGEEVYGLQWLPRSSAISGGRESSSSVLASRTDAGGRFHYTAEEGTEMDGGKHVGGLVWKEDAVRMIRGVPEEGRQKLIMHVEGYCSTQAINTVNADVVYSKSSSCQGHTPSTAVTAIHFSPFIPRAYATGGADGKVMLFNGLVGTAVLSLWPTIDGATEGSNISITALSWSRSRPAILGAAIVAGDAGGVVFYDLSKSGPHVPVVTMGMKGGCTSLVSNPTQRQLWVAVNGRGEVEMIKLGYALSDRLQGEENALRRLLEGSDSGRRLR